MKSRSSAGGTLFPPALLASPTFFQGGSQDIFVPSPLPPGASSAEGDQDSGDLPRGVDEDALEEDDLDTDRITATVEPSIGSRIARESSPAKAARRRFPRI